MCVVQLFFHLSSIHMRPGDYVSNIAKIPHQTLRVVEVAAFVGHTIDFEFAKYILEYDVYLDGTHDEHELAMKLAVEECALKLKADAPPTIEFLVISS